MKREIKFAIVLSAMILCAGPPLSAETVEKIAAVVGERVILASEVANQVQMFLLSYGQNPEIEVNQLYKDILNQMVNDELILTAARDDTSITATDAEIKTELDAHIAALASRFATEEAFLAELRREGMTKRGLEKRYYPQIRDQILKQKIINQKLSKISVSRQEVEEFYRKNSDSLPDVPSQIRLAHILIKFKISAATEDSLRNLADAARELALTGLSFAEVADRFTSQGHNVVGGRIGYVRRNEVVEEFGRTAFSLQPGTISAPILTEYGFHIIKSHRRMSDSVDVSQILFPVVPSAADSLRAKQISDSLYTEIQKGADFKELAKLNSDDDASRSVGGELEPMSREQLRPEFAAAIETIGVDGVAPPVLSQNGYHIIKLLEREDGRPIDFEKDYDVIRNMARQDKTAQMVESWVADLKEKVYVEIREVEI